MGKHLLARVEHRSPVHTHVSITPLFDDSSITTGNSEIGSGEGSQPKASHNSHPEETEEMRNSCDDTKSSE